MQARHPLQRVLSLLLCLAIAASLTLSAFAATVNPANETPEPSAKSDFTFNTTNGMISAYSGSDTTVVIPAEIDGVAVKAIGAATFTGSKATSVVIPSTVTVLMGLPSDTTLRSLYFYGKCPASLDAVLEEYYVDDLTIYCKSSYRSGFEDLYGLNGDYEQEAFTPSATIAADLQDPAYPAVVEPTEPDGSESNPFLISTAADLVALSDKVYSGDTCTGLYYKLTNDIDLNGSADNKFRPIGTSPSSYSLKCFSGHFDGDYHTISNLYVDYYSYSGLFGCVKNATIENLRVEGSVKGSSNTAGIVGYATNSTLRNLSNKATVTGKDSSSNYVGGVAGYIGGDSYGALGCFVENCSNYGDVTGPSSSAKYGGVVGYAFATGTVTNTVTNCYNRGAVNTTATKGDIGGVVGSINSSSSKLVITNCFNQGTVKKPQYGNYGEICGSSYDVSTTNCYESSDTFTAATLGDAYTTDASGKILLKWEADNAPCEHIWVVDEAASVAATCNTPGKTVSKCSKCQAEKEVTSNALGHSFTTKASDKQASAATCTKAATYYAQCDRCDAVSETDTVSVGNPLGHSFTTKASDKLATAATCTEAAAYYVQCDKCDEVSKTETVPVGDPLGHDLTEAVVKATCTADGYTEHTCARCNYNYRDNFVKAQGHAYESNVVAPTCDTMGYTEYTCKNCADSYRTAYTQAKEHNYKAEITTAPTCTAEGVKTFRCEDCNKSYTEPVAKLDHDCAPVVTAPTCTTMGYTTNVCKACGFSYIIAFANPTGHTEVVDAAVAATCTETGLTAGKHCAVCNEVLVKQEVIAAKGHSFENGVCTACGAEDPDYVAPWANPFQDVAAQDWFYDAVRFASQNGLFSGTSANTFSPDAAMTRGMLVSVLWRLDGKTAPKAACDFRDVDANAYYADAIAWATENGIVYGIGGDQFAPDGKITREQLAAILFRYAEFKEVDTAMRADLSAFPDADAVSAYAKDALSWASANSLIHGIQTGSETVLAPQGTATRAQVAAILARYVQNTEK